MKHSKTNKVQGEGDYEATARYRKAVTEFVKSAPVAKLARKAQPKSPAQAADLRKAEAAGRAKSRGEDAHDRMRQRTVAPAKLVRTFKGA